METNALELAKTFLGMEVEVTMDRPIGTKHPKFGFEYTENYGYIEGVKAPDGEYLDAFFLGAGKPLERAKGICIAIAHRTDDDDDKLIVVAEGISMTDREIMDAIRFQEQYFDTEIVRPAVIGHESNHIKLARMTDNDVDEFLVLEKNVRVPKIYNPIVTESDALEEIRDHELFFVKKDSATVGTIAYQKQPNGSVYISNMAVLREHQRRGVARAAMEMVLDIVGDASRIWLVVHPENTKAFNLYTSLGFVVEKQIENYYGDGEPRLVLGKGMRN